MLLVLLSFAPLKEVNFSRFIVMPNWERMSCFTQHAKGLKIPDIKYFSCVPSNYVACFSDLGEYYELVRTVDLTRRTASKTASSKFSTTINASLGVFNIAKASLTILKSAPTKRTTTRGN